MLEYKERIERIHQNLGIPLGYESKHGLVLQKEEVDLLEIENDIYGRQQRMVPEAANAWQSMKKHALKDGIILDIVSAFRSVDKQVGTIRKKIDSCLPMSEILKVCAAPGYSEHHTGRAIDITTIDCEPLSEAFDTTKAFSWLAVNAHDYSFKMSYPKDNRLGISYEPWHWTYVAE